MDMREEDDLQHRWWVGCEDTSGRQRRATVLAPGRSVVLVLPPGETATFTPEAAKVLAVSLMDAADAARLSRDDS